MVENRPGAGTLIAASAVAKAEPDGHLLMMAPSSTMAVNVALYKKLPYDPADRFRSARRARPCTIHLDRASSASGRFAAEFISYAEEQTRASLVRVSRAGRAASSLCRDPDEHDRHRDDPCSLQGQRPRLERRRRRAHSPDVLATFRRRSEWCEAGKVRPLGSPPGAAFRRFRTFHQSRRLVCRNSMSPGWHMMVAPAKTPRQHRRDRLHVELDRHSRAAGDRGRDTAGSVCSAFVNQSLEELPGFVKSEIARWGKVVAARGPRREVGIMRVSRRIRPRLERVEG